MPYKITFRKRAAKEYLESVAWYKSRSLSAAENFVSGIHHALNKIEKQPSQFRKSYKDFYEAKTKKYPFSIVYFIDETKKLIVITSIFHQRRNPEKKFKR
ncbi:MAG: type toxin-antitoxin system RelE/ParE family toxin [Chitinophagaceae bacterium]|nr:type toxin-antitoxin system RelE/ParE family toxin [Chitinophagaceae bacterium]MDB5222314.1 type toxin-antitoxin system RelE/ParE family toxin [Chitinophagaceae bacterium]